MADDKHLEILSQGDEAWNKWRRKNLNVRPDLSEARLSRADLRGANLQEADLQGADLLEADLRRADLQGADLRGANLLEADLREVNLQEADLQGAELLEADLQGADLRGANFQGADLRGANLLEADLREVNLQEVSLQGADLQGAFLLEADLREAVLRVANLRGADLRAANLRGADLRGAQELTCDQLGKAINWELAFRDPNLACGESIPQLVETDAAARSTPFDVEETPAASAEVVLKITPPAKFEWRDGKLHPELTPAPPDRLGKVVREVNTEARDKQLQTVARLAEDNLSTLATYDNDPAKRNVQRFVKDVSGPLNCIAREAAKHGDHVLASYLRAKLTVLENTAAADIEALDGVDQAELRQLLEEGEKLWPFFPELSEIDDPFGAELIPETMANQADDYVEQVIALVESPEGKEIFAEGASDVLRTERDYEPGWMLVAKPEDRILQQRGMMASIGGMVGEIDHALGKAPPSVHALGSFASIATAIKDLWNLVKPFLGF